MSNQQLLDYIKQQLQMGISKEEIKNYLISNGYGAQDIEKAFSEISNTITQSSYISPSLSNISSLPSTRVLLKQSWDIYKKRVDSFLGIMAVPILLTILTFSVSVGGGFFLGWFSSLAVLSDKPTKVIMFLLICLAVLFYTVIFLIIQAWGQTALLYAIKDHQEKIGVVESYRRGWHKTISYLWIYCLTGLVIIGGLLLFIVPGIIFAIWFSLSEFILIGEETKGKKALLKSKQYVKDKLKSVLWRFFCMGTISFIISLALGLVCAFICKILKTPSFMQDIGYFVSGLFLTPLIMIYQFLVYRYLKEIKEKNTLLEQTAKTSEKSLP